MGFKHLNLSWTVVGLNPESINFDITKLDRYEIKIQGDAKSNATKTGTQTTLF